MEVSAVQKEVFKHVQEMGILKIRNTLEKTSFFWKLLLAVTP